MNLWICVAQESRNLCSKRARSWGDMEARSIELRGWSRRSRSTEAALDRVRSKKEDLKI